MNNSLDFENMVRYTFVKDGQVNLPNLVSFKPGDTLVFIKNSDISMTILTKKELENKINEIRKNIQIENERGTVFAEAYESDLNDLYEAILTTAKVEVKEWNPKTEEHNVCYVDLGLIKYFLSEEVASGKEPVVFRHDGKQLLMY